MRYLIFLVLLFIGCTTTKYVEVPVKELSTQYRDVVKVDTLILHDSVVIRQSNDTVYKEKFKYIYKKVEVRDTILITDTIQKPVIIQEKQSTDKYQIITLIGGVVIFLGIYKLFK